MKVVVEQILEQVRNHFRDYEIILIDDGSSDRTGAIMDSFAQIHERIRVEHNGSNLGLGASYKRGVALATKEYLMLLCGDGGLPARSLPSIFEQIGKADIVIPYMTNLRQIKTPLRYFLSRGYTTLLNLLFGFRLNYYNGLPVHRLDLLRCIDITSSGFGFQGEVLIKLLKSGCSYVQVGVSGAEETKRSFALRASNLVSVARTVIHLIAEIVNFRPIPHDIIVRGRGGDSACSAESRTRKRPGQSD